MGKKLILTLILFFVLVTHSFGAASGPGDGEKRKTSYEKGAYIIKKAKRYEKKGKIDKAKNNIKKHLNF